MSSNWKKRLPPVVGPSTQSAALPAGCAFLALLSLGIKPGDEVLTTPYTFLPPWGNFSIGAAPVFVDIEPDSFNMDMDQVAAVMDAHPKIRAVIPIHLLGHARTWIPSASLPPHAVSP